MAVTDYIRVHVIDEDNGYQEMDDVKGIRIKSSRYTLLIMRNYTPTLGSIDGDICFIRESGELTLDNIKGFYKLHHNEFTLLVEEDKDGWYTTW